MQCASLLNRLPGPLVGEVFALVNSAGAPGDVAVHVAVVVPLRAAEADLA